MRALPLFPLLRDAALDGSVCVVSLCAAPCTDDDRAGSTSALDDASNSKVLVLTSTGSVMAWSVVGMRLKHVFSSSVGHLGRVSPSPVCACILAGAVPCTCKRTAS